MARYVILDSNNVIENTAEADSALESNWHLVEDSFEGEEGDTYVPSTSTLTRKTVTYTVEEAGVEAVARLAATDWTQLPDVGLTTDNVIEWRTHRTALRAIAKSPTANPTWPTEPTEEYV